MINLLPEQEKKELEVEKTGRKLSLFFLFLFIFILILIFILFSLKIYILSQIKHSQDILENTEKALQTSQFQGFKQAVEKTNQNLSQIQSFSAQKILFTPLLEKLSNLIPQQAIYFNNLSLKKISQEEIFAEIHISGYAALREDLFAFKKTLEGEKEFEDVYFPPSSWVTPANIQFSLSFSIR